MRERLVRRLLANQAGEDGSRVGGRASVSRWVGWISLILALVAGAAATQLQGEAQAGAFFGSGGLVLTALLGFRRGAFSQRRYGAARQARRLGARPVGHPQRRESGPQHADDRPGGRGQLFDHRDQRFRLDPPDSVLRRNSGSGGFSLVAQSDLPIYRDLNSDEGREELGFSAAESKQFAGREIVSLRLKPGDDASCLNLYQPRQPRMLGVGEALIRRGGFAWAASAAATDEERANPWRLLDKPMTGADGKPAVPVVMDANTATYSLHLSGVGAAYEISDGRGGQLALVVVGLLKNSLFQGDLMIGEQAFLAHFPETSGYRYFLIDAPPEQQTAVETALENRLGDFGFDVEPTTRRLAGFMAVQNTYLSTFQSLGGLGLLLGTFGVAVVQLRNVLEPPRRVGLACATGFRRSMLAKIVVLENAMLLAGGLGVGILAAAVPSCRTCSAAGLRSPGFACRHARRRASDRSAGWSAGRAPALSAPLLSACAENEARAAKGRPTC